MRAGSQTHNYANHTTCIHVSSIIKSHIIAAIPKLLPHDDRFHHENQSVTVTNLQSVMYETELFKPSL